MLESSGIIHFFSIEIHFFLFFFLENGKIFLYKIILEVELISFPYFLAFLLIVLVLLWVFSSWTHIVHIFHFFFFFMTVFNIFLLILYVAFFTSL